MKGRIKGMKPPSDRLGSQKEKVYTTVRTKRRKDGKYDVSESVRIQRKDGSSEIWESQTVERPKEEKKEDEGKKKVVLPLNLALGCVI